MTGGAHAQEDRGFVYVSTGDSSVARMCLASITSLRDWGCSDPVFIITDQTHIRWPRDKTIVHQVPGCSAGFSSRDWKLQVGSLSPFTRSIYLDCDMLATPNLKNIWDEVGKDGFGLTLDTFPTLHHALVREYASMMRGNLTYSWDEHFYMAQVTDIDGPHYNSGIIAWENNAESARLFSHWHQEWKRFSGRDQFALARAIKSSGVAIQTLSESYNSRATSNASLPQAINRNTIIVHFFDDKKAFHPFFHQINLFKAIDTPTQEKLQAVFKAPLFKNRPIIGLLLLPFICPGSIGPRTFLLIGQSIFAIARDRLRKRVLGARGPL